MSDLKLEGMRGPKGEQGPRGHHGHHGATGPTGATGPAGGSSGTGLIAAASISSDGSEFSGFGFASTSHTGTGVYLLTLSSPPADVDIIPVVTLFGFTGLIRVSAVSGGVIQVEVFTVGEVAADANFFIHVTDGA